MLPSLHGTHLYCDKLHILTEDCKVAKLSEEVNLATAREFLPIQNINK
jgi:hypothetical protein